VNKVPLINEWLHFSDKTVKEYRDENPNGVICEQHDREYQYSKAKNPVRDTLQTIIVKKQEYHFTSPIILKDQVEVQDSTLQDVNNVPACIYSCPTKV
jgi:hypothetical protein